MDHFKKIITILILIFLVFVALFFLALSSVLSPDSFEQDFARNTVTINNSEFVVQISDSSAERMRGLSGKISLGPDEGMLFVYEEENKPGIWMKNMNFPIDILWISKDKEVVHIEKNISPQTYPKIYYPDEDVLYVLELSAGTVDNSDIELGNSVSFNQNIF